VPIKSSKRIKITPNNALAQRVLPIVHAKQKESNWCWAACFNMAFDYFHFDISQCKIAGQYFSLRGDKQDCCKHPGICDNSISDAWISDLYSFWNYRFDFHPNQITFNNIQTTINHNKLIEVGLSWAGGGGHVALVNGWSDDTQDEVYVNDPGSGNGPGLINYTELQNAYGQGVWDATWDSIESK